MAEHPSAAATQRVALLARPGKAADNLADALRQAGADLVLVADPNSMDERALIDARLQAVLVALEPGVEHAIDRLDEVLSSPDLTVIFDEADLAAHRAGWDAARWVRHLSAKLNHHQRVLPPGGEAETEEWYPSPGQLPKPASAFAEMNLDTFAEEAAARATDVPADGMHFDSASAEFGADAAKFDAIVQEAAQAAQTPAAPVASFVPEPVVEALPVRETVTIDVSAPSFSDAPIETIESVREHTAPTGLSLDGLSPESMSFEAMPLEVMPLEPMPLEPMPHVEETREEPFAFEENLQIEENLLVEQNLQTEEIMVIEPEFAASGDAAGVQPMRFDDDAFFLEELSADTTTKPAAADSAVDFDFDSIPTIEDEPSAAVFNPGRQFDLEVTDLSFEPLHDEAPAPALDAMPEAKFEAVQEVAPVSPSPGFAQAGFGELSLVTDDAPLAQPQPRADVIKHDLSSLESRISGLSLVDLEPIEATSESMSALEPMTQPAMQAAIESAPVASPSAMPPPLPPSAASSWEAPIVSVTPVSAPPMAVAAATDAPASGIVLIEAGLGGPDPVRQVLAGLPATFATPVLVRLHLQGGRYDRLVTQMERAASLPVKLAEVGQQVRTGCIYFLPEGVGLQAAANGMQFIAHPSPAATIFAALPSDESAVLFLSGSDSALIEDAMQAAEAGALVAAQSPEDCYDGAACAYLRSRGAASGLPPELARSLLARWPS